MVGSLQITTALFLSMKNVLRHIFGKKIDALFLANYSFL
jgi:hypothetical protein